MMKLSGSGDLVNTENQPKKRKLELISSENTDDANIKSPSKKNKRTADQDNSFVVLDKCHSKDTSVDNSPRDKNKNDSSLRDTSIEAKINTEPISTFLNHNAQSSNAVDIQYETNIETSPKKNKKKLKEISLEVDLVSNNNATTLSTYSLSNSNEKDVNSSNHISQSEQHLSKKSKKKKRKSIEIHQEVDTISTNNSTHSSPKSSSNFNEENINEPTIDCSNEVSQPEFGSPKKKQKRKKTNIIDNSNSNESESVSINDTTANTSSSVIINGTDNTAELVESIEETFPRKLKKRKRRTNDETTNESESVSSTNPTSAPDTTDPKLFSNTDKSSEPVKTTLSKKARKKAKGDKNSNLPEPVLPNSSENISATTDVPPSKPLKSCLKKKKRKIKKKKNLKRLSIENSTEEDKKASNRSVSFDDNLKIEVIENCLVKVEAQNARKKDKALAYLKRWREKQNWKFEKLTQSWLLKNMFREDMIPAEEFEYLLEYMVDLKGVARTLVDNLCEEVITNVGEKVPEEGEKELFIAYTRARAVLQRLS